MSIDYSKLTPAENLRGEDTRDTQELMQLRRDAKSFIESFGWCEGVDKDYFGIGIGRIFGVFLERLKTTDPSIPEELWVVVGDIPAAYLCTDDAPNPATALDAYIFEMQRWIKAVREGSSLDDVIPVNAPATPEYANMLESRLEFLDSEVLSGLSEDLKA